LFHINKMLTAVPSMDPISFLSLNDNKFKIFCDTTNVCGVFLYQLGLARSAVGVYYMVYIMSKLYPVMHNIQHTCEW